jgi:hypothetical protein
MKIGSVCAHLRSVSSCFLSDIFGTEIIPLFEVLRVSLLIPPPEYLILLFAEVVKLKK